MTLGNLLQQSVGAEPVWIDSDTLIHQLFPCTDRSIAITTNDDFDLGYRDIRASLIYKEFKNRSVGKPWDETKLLAKKQPRYRARRYKYWDAMLDDIINNGYSFRPFDKCAIDEYISVLIWRDGHILLYNGIHRACCCLLSKVKNKIPVRVIYRHPEWQAFKDSVLKYQARHEKLYCQLPHPDLETIPHYWDNERVELIAIESVYKGGRVLDIGTHWGATSHTLAGRGFDCTAIERHPGHFKKADKVSRMNPRGTDRVFRALNEDALDFNPDGKYDALVMLNLAHHFQDTEKLYARFMAFLERGKFKEIFYQSHKPGDKWSTQSAMSLPPTESLRRIMTAAGLQHSVRIATFGNRGLYHIY